MKRPKPFLRRKQQGPFLCPTQGSLQGSEQWEDQLISQRQMGLCAARSSQSTQPAEPSLPDIPAEVANS